MPWENGVEWRPIAPEQRGRHATFSSAVEAAVKELLAVRSPFLDALGDRWRELFPDLPATPGKFENGVLRVCVKNAPTLFMLRPRLPAIKRRLAELPDAPANLRLVLEIRG